jgi:hypothetical protein
LINFEKPQTLIFEIGGFYPKSGFVDFEASMWSFGPIEPPKLEFETRSTIPTPRFKILPNGVKLPKYPSRAKGRVFHSKPDKTSCNPP